MKSTCHSQLFAVTARHFIIRLEKSFIEIIAIEDEFSPKKLKFIKIWNT